MDVRPTRQALAGSDRVASLESHLCERGDLHAALVDGTLTFAVDDGREDEGGLDGGCFLGGFEDVVVYDARVVGADEVPD